jgi:hypothetical protein
LGRVTNIALLTDKQARKVKAGDLKEEKAHIEDIWTTLEKTICNGWSHAHVSGRVRSFQ